MPDYDSGETIAFILDMPSGMIEELKQALEGLEVIFDPNQQVIAFTHGITSQTVAMGNHIPGMVLEINRSLDEAGLTPRIPEVHEKWSTLRRQAFLQFSVANFDWVENRINEAWWEDKGITWRKLTRDNPLIFKEPE